MTWMNVNSRNNLRTILMIKLLPLVVTLFVVGCSPGSPHAGDAAFDAYLEKLMAEPYDPNNGSKY